MLKNTNLLLQKTVHYHFQTKQKNMSLKLAGITTNLTLGLV